MDAFVPVIAVLSFLLVGAAIFTADFLLERRNLRATRIVTCPQTSAPAAVHLQGGAAALDAALGRPPRLKIDQCSRWPRAAGCPQACLAEIEAHPITSLLDYRQKEWERTAACSRCGLPLHPPGPFRGTVYFVTPPGSRFEWRELPEDWLSDALAGWKPLCQRCAERDDA